MLAVVIDNVAYAAIEAQEFQDHCEASGVETDWWAPLANVITLASGIGPSTAYVLLTYSTIKLLNPLPAAITALGGGSVGDEVGLSGDDGNDDSHRGSNFYNRILRIFDMVQRLDTSGNPVQAPSGTLTNKYKDLEGWTLIGTKAIDSQQDPTADDTVHLAKFTDIRGLHQLVQGAFSNNYNVVNKLVVSADPNIDVWGFENNPLILNPLNQVNAWPDITAQLWSDIYIHFPNIKYDNGFLGTFNYPYFDDGGIGLPSNNRPHNLFFKDMTVWEAFVEYANKISHEVFPTHAGKFTVLPIDSHTEEDITWITSLTDPYRGLKLQFGQELYSRISYLIDHDHPPRLMLVPHSFTATFTKTLGTNEQLAVLPIALWRGTGHTFTYGGFVPIESGSLFTQELVKDGGKFPAQFLTDHPYVLAGDYVGERGTDRAERTRTQYVDCTFFAVPTTEKEPGNLNIDDADDGLRSCTQANSYPAPDIGRLISKRHLKAQIFGDLGSVVLSGLHDLLPSNRHQTVILNLGADGPSTTLIGVYEVWSPFPRKVAPRNLDIIETGEYEGLAVVYSLTPADYSSEPAQVGSASTIDFVQDSVNGQAYPLTWSGTELVIASPATLVNFKIVRGDTLIAKDTIIFIKNKVGHTVSAGDYIRFFPNDTTDPTSDRVLVRQASTNRLIWATGSNFVGPTGPAGGGSGVSVAAGYAIQTTGTTTVTVHNNPPDWTGNADTYQFFRHLVGQLTTRTGPHWKSVGEFDAAKNQMQWHQSDAWHFKTTTDYAGAAATPQFLLNWGAGNGGDWQWKSVTGYNAAVGVRQQLWNVAGDWKWDYSVGHDLVNIKVPTSISLAIVGTVLRATIHYDTYEVVGKNLGAPGQGVMNGDILITAC